MKTAVLFIVVAALASLTGCSDPCGDIKDCCVATAEASDTDASGCDIYDEADDDACQAAIDSYEVPDGVDVPEECDL